MSRSFRAINVAACCLLVLSFWYAATYVLMMDHRQWAFDPDAGDFVDQSAYRCARWDAVRVPGDRTVYIGGSTVCLANDVFRPIDVPVRRAFPWPLDYAGGVP